MAQRTAGKYSLSNSATEKTFLQGGVDIIVYIPPDLPHPKSNGGVINLLVEVS